MTRFFAIAWTALALAVAAAAAMFVSEVERFLEEAGSASGFSSTDTFLMAQSGMDTATLVFGPYAATATVLIGASFVLLLAHARRWRPQEDGAGSGR